MSNDLVKFLTHETDDIPEGWHLTSNGSQHGEYTACGLAIPEYETEGKTMQRGGITCENCLAVIRYFKSIKL